MEDGCWVKEDSWRRMDDGRFRRRCRVFSRRRDSLMETRSATDGPMERLTDEPPPVWIRFVLKILAWEEKTLESLLVQHVWCFVRGTPSPLCVSLRKKGFINMLILRICKVPCFGGALVFAQAEFVGIRGFDSRTWFVGGFEVQILDRRTNGTTDWPS